MPDWTEKLNEFRALSFVKITSLSKEGGLDVVLQRRIEQETEAVQLYGDKYFQTVLVISGNTIHTHTSSFNIEV